MARQKRFAKLLEQGFDIQFISHAEAILESDFPDALNELEDVLTDLRLPITEIIGSGGGETKFTQRLRRALTKLGWHKHEFRIGKTIDGVLKESISHEVDHVKSFGDRTLAMEIEWNNKDPFFDRDLENFKRLHADGAISAGVLLTRGQSLQESIYDLIHRYADAQGITGFQDLEGKGYEPTRKQISAVMKRVTREKNPLPFVEAWAGKFVSDKFGQATTHWNKLQDRVTRGVGNPCPLLLIGLPASIVDLTDTNIEMFDEADALADPEDSE